MDKDNANEEQPTSSRKDIQRINSGADLYDDKRKYDERRRHHDKGAEGVSNTESFTSSYSGRSRVEVTEANVNMPKPQGVKREKEVRERATNPRKKRARRTSKVQKRGRSVARRRVTRRAPRRRPRARKERAPSVSTILTRLSSAGSASHHEEHLCQVCGHRCCRRRYNYQKRRAIPRKIKVRKAVTKIRKHFSAKAMQAGSRSLMLSPLFINTNLPTPTELDEERTTFCEITPEMIYEAVRKLTMWRQFAQTSAILQYMKLNFPVNPEERELLAELDEKLHVAAIAEIITQESEDRWCLSCRLQNRYLSKNHVTRFWQVYGDTLRPVMKRTENKPQENAEENKSVPQNQLEFLLNEKYIV